ncbi:Acetyl esterase (plasmid) [Variovorax sp. PBS-H4]|uniref:alpha/beta hydrolase n=1 Tax=Variovorax sp. PBS-H4 TaxID=434008 RepID=UPI001318AABA|nr:alpha/beta hydrolase [Variovorax sp. PBS-H4]VTU41400.1 Acetyl esterase [Variovorax sp. PBS-H4]
MNKGVRDVAWAAAGLVSAGVLAAVMVRSSPRWVSAIVKGAFEQAGSVVARRMQAHVIPGVTEQTRLSYRPGDPDAFLTMHRRQGSAGLLPVVVWIHGGGWISGNSSNVDPYLQIMTARTGIATVSVDYTPGPRASYPTAVQQIQDALAYLDQHAEELGVDRNRIVLAGDSAGAQLATQTAAIITNPDAAAVTAVAPALAARQLRGMILHCGVYDPVALAGEPGPLGWVIQQVLRAYTGTRSLVDSAALTQMSAAQSVNGNFPPTFMSAGNADQLTEVQSKPFAEHLERLGVPTRTVFFAQDHEPRLPHEFQFNLDGDDGQRVLAESIAFITDLFNTTSGRGPGRLQGRFA